MRLTEHFTVAELSHSYEGARKGIPNTPPSALYPNLLRLAEGLERVRGLVGGPVVVMSGYRCPALNKAVGGAPRSQHMSGLAADIRVPGHTARALARTLAAHGAQVGFDQLILEFPDRPGGGWVHVSFDLAPRGELLTASGRPTTYTKGIA